VTLESESCCLGELLGQLPLQVLYPFAKVLLLENRLVDDLLYSVLQPVDLTGLSFDFIGKDIRWFLLLLLHSDG
jgi:hypothetical protein